MKQDQPKQNYWFKKKRFGFGWYPASKEGWIVMVIFTGFVLFLSLGLGQDPTEEALVREFFVPFYSSIILFIVIAWKTGEPLK